MIFTQEEVIEFCKLVGDTNPIHKEDIGIVPGLLVTSVITKDPSPDIMIGELSVRYLNPLYVNEEFELVTTKIKSKMGSHFIDYEIKTKDCIIQRIHCVLVTYHKNLDHQKQIPIVDNYCT